MKSFLVRLYTASDFLKNLSVGISLFRYFTGTLLLPANLNHFCSVMVHGLFYLQLC
jgi:hypothetical protein